MRERGIAMMMVCGGVFAKVRKHVHTRFSLVLAAAPSTRDPAVNSWPLVTHDAVN